jgi:hypothetical protein
MATSDNFPPPSRPEEFPRAVVAGIGDAGWDHPNFIRDGK